MVSTKDKRKALELIKLYIENQKIGENLLTKYRESFKNKKMGKKKITNSNWDLKIVPETDWTFVPHGKGITFSNSKTKRIIDYDYGVERRIGGFDSWRLHNFVENLIKINKLNAKEYSKFLEDEFWKSILKTFHREGIVRKDRLDPKYGLYFLEET